MSKDEAGPDATEQAFDAYLDAALGGNVEPPEEFLARHPSTDPTLRRRIRSIYDEYGRGAADPVTPSVDTRRVGEFRLVRRLGEGGMGVVWEAEQESLDRRVALKLLRSDLDSSPEAVERFVREARMLARLDHPGIVRVIAAGQDGGARYLAMDLVAGRGLDEMLRDETGSFDTPRVLRWGAQLARALAYAHEQGVVHRDVKPSNVLVGADDRALLVDFGIARASNTSLPTLTGPFVGSAAYAPPEQLTGARVDGRADVYALGATLYQCVTGTPAFDGATVDQLIHQVLNVPPTPPSRRIAGLSDDVDVVLGKALAKRPERRYETAGDLADDLEALLAFRPISARPPSGIERAREWARTHPGVAAALMTALTALVVVGAALISQSVREERGRRRDARRAVEQAVDRFDAYRERHAGVAGLERTVLWTRAQSESRYMSDDELREFDTNERDLAEAIRERETVFHEVLSLLRDAEQLQPGVDGAATLRARVFAEKHHQAVEQQDERSAAFYADMVTAAEPGGAVAENIRFSAQLELRTEPPGAEVHLFRYEELSDLVDGGDRRLIPVPIRGFAEGTTPGEVTERRGADGHVRRTAAALHIGERSRIGVAPIEDYVIGRGEYLLVTVLPGRVPARRPLRVRDRWIDPVLMVLPEHAVPGCALVQAPAENEGDSPFWIMDRELTCAEYMPFLNDPETLAEVDATDAAIRLPRSLENSVSGGYWLRGDDGRFDLPSDWSPDWPILGVSWDDAVAYATWRTARDPKYSYRLPTLGEALAAAGEPHRKYPFGMHFRPRFASSCYSTPTAAPEPVLSYPIDESPYGVFDLAGSASEWCDGWYDESAGRRRANFGNWGAGEADRFEVWSAVGWSSDVGAGVVGFRLVVEPK